MVRPYSLTDGIKIMVHGQAQEKSLWMLSGLDGTEEQSL